MSDDGKRQANRDRFPEVARVVDEVRKYFPGAKVMSIRPMSDEKKLRLAEYDRKVGPQRPGEGR